MINEKRLIDNYLEMIRIKSISGNEKNLADYIYKKLSSLGLEPRYVYYDEEKKESPCVIAEIKGKELGPTLLMIGHIDTVDVANGWETNPFEPVIEGDKVYALGAMDMKGGLSCILETAEYIVENNIELKGNLVLAFACDEEVLSRGTYKMIQEGLKADMAIMAECRFEDAAVGFRGRYSIEVNVKGKTGHASKYPYVGENAIIKASKLAVAIESLGTKTHEYLGEGTWCIRYIEGGYQKTLSVPDHCYLFVDRYVVPGEDFAYCKMQIEEAAENLGMKEDVEIQLKERPLPYMDAFSIPQDHEIVKIVSKNYKEVVGKELGYAYDKSVCDSNFLVTVANIPTITFGPSGGNMHAANEYGYVSQIKHAAKIYIKTVEDILMRIEKC
ncbi:M20/M25/M40 family metallo-hydrolase [Clostridiaceae bacterium 35-E11]